jgi:hypothetical protein
MHANEHPTGGPGHHEFVAPAAAKDPLAKAGYQQKEYSRQEYPKVVGKNAEGQDVVVKSAEEEKAFLAKKASTKPAAAPAE